MYKLMIVEDEDRNRNGIKKCINWEEYGFRCMAEACNGQDALEKVELEKPDVIITDVRMPIMDGLELTHIINEKYKDIKVIILSGYSDFDFVRSAIKLRVFDYLLKPTDIKVFTDTFKALKTAMDSERKQKELFDAKKKYIDQNFSNLRREYILKILAGLPESLGTIHEWLDFFELDLTGDIFSAAVFRVENSSIIEAEKEDQYMSAYANTFKQILGSKNIGETVVKDIHEIIVIFHFKQDNYDSHEILDTVTLLIDALNKLDPSLKVSAGIGLLCPLIFQISKSYSQAIKALERKFFNHNQNVFIYHASDDLSLTSENQWFTSTPNKIYTIINETISGNVDNALRLLDKIFDRFSTGNFESAFIKEYCYILLFLLKQNLPESQVQFPVQISLTEIKNDINNRGTVNDVRLYLKNYITSICKTINDFNFSDKGYHYKIVDKIKKYLADNFEKNITLDKLSELVHLSSAYISFLFKSVTGENYMDYLKKIRMEKAIEYLQNSDMKIYEIADRVGYSDYKYFTLQFKKMYGFSPTEFRNKSGATSNLS